MSERNGNVAASFVIEEGDELMMVTNGGKVIRMPTHDIRIAGRKTQGVTLVRTAEDEDVVAVERLSNLGGDEEGEGEDGEIEGAEGIVETTDETTALTAPDAAQTSADETGDEAPESDSDTRDE